LEFENGVLIINYSKILPLISTVKSIVEPIIFQGRLSGKIRIERLNDRVTIGYDDVKSFEYLPELMHAIRKSSSSEIMGKYILCLRGAYINISRTGIFNNLYFMMGLVDL
jgi:hypothetical protein